MITFNAVTLAQVSSLSLHNSIRINGLQAKIWPHFPPYSKSCIGSALNTGKSKLHEVVCCFCAQFSCSFTSDSLQLHGLQHSRPLCPSPTPGVYLNLCLLSQWCHPTISSSVIPFTSSPQSFPTSGVFSNESVVHIRWPKYWSFSFSISPSNEHPGLISFTINWLDLLAVQGTLKSLLQHHSSKASILWCSACFFGPTLTSIHDYWKNHSFD